ncbi:prolyl aminopeptidase [Paucibacter sp. B2R-40]|uniref:prolyl aminopeptidase n=1 Tax=Paucibacter sp. B2R-40 TaxID=2893554 RepID=UPI0021E39C1A|nr:prolyl aminopeptidase [Paucibacter sp. B2R-40]MCV2353717.1 prolyl aminopeptidase [Paucibacter sp. B2R-40]
MFAPIDAFASGHLATTDGNEIYWECSGNAQGQPALYLHGGPGSGIMSGYRRHFDPARFLIVSFEQRGCGRSRPLAIDASANLHTNTTQHLIVDIEMLRSHLGVDRWLIYGSSWGTTLALAYAQAHAQRVLGLVLAAVTTTTAAEVHWLTQSMSLVFPREWEQFAQASGARANESLIDAYYRRITDADPAVRAAAARAWCAWEDVHVSLAPNSAPNPRYQDPEFRLLFATLVIHYWQHAGFLRENEIHSNMHKIAHLPGVLIHGRLDISSPLDTPWQLHKRWPGSELVLVDGEGHGGVAMAQGVSEAVARLAPRLLEQTKEA